MNPTVQGSIILVVTVLTLLSGIPVAFGLGAVAVVFMVVFQGFDSLQVVAETSEWRRVCDPEGTLAWVHKRTTDGRRMAMNTHTSPVPLLKRPKDGFAPAAYLSGRALASLDRCSKGWCKVSADHAAGWVRQGVLWGTTDSPQCH